MSKHSNSGKPGPVSVGWDQLRSLTRTSPAAVQTNVQHSTSQSWKTISTKPGIFGLPLLNGQHTAANIALIAFILGTTTGCGIGLCLMNVEFYNLRALMVLVASLTTLIYVKKMMRQDSRGGLFDGRHTPQNIAAYAYLLGCTHGAGIVVGWFSNAGRGLALFFALLALFHFLEYLCTAMYRSDVKLQAFLLNHSREYHLAMIAGVVEYSVEAYFVPSLKVFCWWNWLALFGVLLAQTLRSTAMITAGRNFTHIIADDRDPAHTLVTTGVYSIFRHPAYTAFFYWGVLMQVMLANPLCSLAYAVALYSFFESRIPYEEITLINFFGDDYDRYRSKTHVLIPGIR